MDISVFYILLMLLSIFYKSRMLNQTGVPNQSGEQKSLWPIDYGALIMANKRGLKLWKIEITVLKFIQYVNYLQ